MSSKASKQNNTKRAATVEKKQMWSYWQDKGLHQEKDTILRDEFERVVGDDGFQFDWHNKDVKHWALVNGMWGLYYGFYNDGDNAKGAIDNGRTQGYHSVKAFEALANDLGAKAVVSYLHYSTNGTLEKAMDEAILIAWEKKNSL